MKSYKEFDKNFIGCSDIASLILAGYVEDKGVELKELHFASDGRYNAYIVEGEAEISEHYKEVARFSTWMKIYDDEMLTQTFKAKKIIVYRAREMGCIIQLINN